MSIQGNIRPARWYCPEVAVDDLWVYCHWVGGSVTVTMALGDHVVGQCRLDDPVLGTGEGSVTWAVKRMVEAMSEVGAEDA